MAKPVSIDRQASITGGSLAPSKPWLVPVQRIQDRDFFEVTRKSSGLARFIGRAGKNPLKDFVYFDELRARRNALIKAELLAGGSGTRSDVTHTHSLSMHTYHVVK